MIWADYPGPVSKKKKRRTLKRINRVFGELMFTFKESLLTCARISTEKLARVS